MKVFTLPFPVSLNQAYTPVVKYKNGKPYAAVLLSTKGRAYKELVKQLLPKEDLLEGDLTLTLLIYAPDKRRRDCDNFPKLLQDAMNGIIYTDDSQIEKLVIEKKGLDREEPRVIVEIDKYN